MNATSEPAWIPADCEAVPGAEKVYTSTRYGGTWHVALVNDVMHRWVLVLSGRVSMWPLAAFGLRMEAVFERADQSASSHRDAVARTRQ